MVAFPREGPHPAKRGLAIGLALLVLLVALGYATLRHAPVWEEQAAAGERLSAWATTQAAASPAPAKVKPQIGPGVTPSPEKLLPVDNSSLRQLKRRPGAETPPQAEPSAEKPDDTVPRPTLLPRPVALDSGSFRIGRSTVTIEGITPLAPNETCGTGASAWFCGAKARTALRALVRSRSVTCTVPGDFAAKEQTVDSACSLGATDLGQWLVENGWARARDDGRYTAVEGKARAAHVGIWAERDQVVAPAITSSGAPQPDAPADVTPSPADLPAPPQ